MFHRFALTSLMLLSLVVTAHTEIIKDKVVATASVVYAKDKEGNKKTGLMSLVMTKGEKVKFLSLDYYKGSFVLHLDMLDGKKASTALDPLCIPLTAGGKLQFPTDRWPIVTHDFNKDGISEFNLSQHGNSWGAHYMLFTFSKDGSGKIITMTVDKEKEYNYLHPQAGRPSTNLLLETKEGFKHLFTERGEISREVYIHFYWSAKTQQFREQKRVPINE